MVIINKISSNNICEEKLQSVNIDEFLKDVNSSISLPAFIFMKKNVKRVEKVIYELNQIAEADINDLSENSYEYKKLLLWCLEIINNNEDLEDYMRQKNNRFQLSSDTSYRRFSISDFMAIYQASRDCVQVS